MNGSRRAFLAATATTVATGVGSQPAAATAAGSRPVGGLTISENTSVFTDVTAAFERAHPDVPVVTESDGFERFVRGRTDVHHAARPMTADERERANENGVDVVGTQLPLGGIAALGRTDGEWCRCLSDGGHDAYEKGDAEIWSEIAADSLPDREQAALPEEGSTALVRGVRSHQYAIGHGGVGCYEAAPSAFESLEKATDLDRLTPAVRLGFAYVDRAALDRDPVAAFARFQDASAIDVEHFPIPESTHG